MNCINTRLHKNQDRGKKKDKNLFVCPVLPVKQLAWEIGNLSWVYRENCQKKIILTDRVLFLEKLFGGLSLVSWDLTD